MALDKTKLIYLHGKGLKPFQIAKELGCHQNTVSRWIQRFVETGNLDRKKGSGRKRILSEEDVNELEKRLKKDGQVSYNEHRAMMKINVSRRTLNDYGIKLGFRKYF